jgi:Ser/Thr protein kinase RdoA (MazF antagonist)
MTGETDAVRIPADADVLSSGWLTEALQSRGHWREGSVRVLGVARIGETYGFSGHLHRVSVAAATGRTLTLVVKEETAEAVDRELLVRRHVRDEVLDSMARCFAGAVDHTSGRGVLVLEDVTPATQGDVLGGCSLAFAEAAVRALARLHGTTWREHDDFPSQLPRWPARGMDGDRWRERLARAHLRFPEIVTAELVARLGELPNTVDTSLAQLRGGPAAWIHADAHLDNILWRADGSAVVLDWTNAAIGPSAFDVALFLSHGVEPQWRALLTAGYADEIERYGAEPAAIDIERRVVLALPYLLQGLIGWAGREDLPQRGRLAATCRAALRSITSWTDASGSQMGCIGS